MLDEDIVLQHRDLGEFVVLSHDHGAGDGFPAGEEFGFAEDGGTPTPGCPPFASSLTLGLHAGRTLDARDLVRGAVAARLAHLDHDIGVRIVVVPAGVLTTTTPAPAPTPRRAGRCSVVPVVVAVVVVGSVSVRVLGVSRVVVRVLGVVSGRIGVGGRTAAAATTPSTPAAPPTTAARGPLRCGVSLVGVVVIRIVVVGVIVRIVVIGIIVRIVVIRIVVIGIIVRILVVGIIVRIVIIRIVVIIGIVVRRLGVSRTVIIRDHICGGILGRVIVGLGVGWFDLAGFHRQRILGRPVVRFGDRRPRLILGLLRLRWCVVGIGGRAGIGVGRFRCRAGGATAAAAPGGGSAVVIGGAAALGPLAGGFGRGFGLIGIRPVCKEGCAELRLQAGLEFGLELRRGAIGHRLGRSGRTTGAAPAAWWCGQIGRGIFRSVRLVEHALSFTRRNCTGHVRWNLVRGHRAHLGATQQSCWSSTPAGASSAVAWRRGSDSRSDLSHRHGTTAPEAAERRRRSRPSTIIPHSPPKPERGQAAAPGQASSGSPIPVSVSSPCSSRVSRTPAGTFNSGCTIANA